MSTKTTSHFGGEKGLFHLTACGLSWKEAREGIWTQKQRPRKNTVYWLALHGLPSLLSCTAQDHLPRSIPAHSSWVILHQYSIKKMSHLPTDWGDGLPLFPNMSSFMSNWQYFYALFRCIAYTGLQHKSRDVLVSDIGGFFLFPLFFDNFKFEFIKFWFATYLKFIFSSHPPFHSYFLPPLTLLPSFSSSCFLPLSALLLLYETESMSISF